jgi:hypothetical protein
LTDSGLHFVDLVVTFLIPLAILARPRGLMSIEFVIHSASSLVTCTVENAPTQEDAREFFEILLVHAEFESEFNLLADCRGYGCELIPAFVRSFSKEVRNRTKQLGPSRWAFVTMKASDFASVRLIGLLTYGSWVEFAPFMNMEDAVDWVKCGTAERRALVEAR